LYKTSRPKQLAWSLASAAASAAVLYALLPVTWALGIIYVVIIHEGAHFLTAKAVGLRAALPVFIPLGPLTAGVTAFEVSDLRARWWVYAAGPVAGAAAALLVALMGSWVPLVGLWKPGTILAGAEALTLMVGGDGKKMRRALEAPC
jgi:hypothetical protein